MPRQDSTAGATLGQLAACALISLTALTLLGCPSAPTPTPDPTPSQSVQSVPAARSRQDAWLGAEAGVTAFKVGDLVVLHKPTPANQVVSAQLYFVGGAMRLTPSSQGVERLLLSVATQGGTQASPKDDFNAKLDALGASVGSFTDRDYSGLAMKTIVPYFPEVFALMAQAALSPALPEQEIDLEKKRQVAQYDAIFENNDSLVSHQAAQLLFEGHPYANTQLGTRDTISALTRQDLLDHHKRLIDPTNMLLVVVGNIPHEALKDQVTQAFGQLKGSGQPQALPPALTPRAGRVVSDVKTIPTHYIFGLFPAPAPDHPDYAAMVVATDYLSDRLFEEVRTKRNLTYAVSAGLSSRASNYGYLYVTAVNPPETLSVIYAEIDRLASAPMTDQELKETLNVYLTSYYKGLETNSSQAGMLAQAQLVSGDWRQAARFLESLRAVKGQDIQRVVKAYISGLQFSVVGPTAIKADDPLYLR